MDKNVKFTLDLIGLLISISGIIIFFKDEKFTIAVILIIVAIVSLIFAYYHITLPNYKIIRLKWKIDIKDKSGKKADALKSKLITANKRNIKSIVDRNFTTSGSYDFINCNLGEIHGPYDEGGSEMITTILKAELPINKKIEQILKLKLKDSFTEEKENLSTLIDQVTDEIEIVINLPSTRPVKSAKAFRYRQDQAIELPNIAISQDMLTLSFLYSKPKIGEKFVVEWQW